MISRLAVQYRHGCVLQGTAALRAGGGAIAALGACAGKEGSEHALFHALLPNIADDDLLLADRYYCSYVRIALLQARGADIEIHKIHKIHRDL